MEHLFRVIAAAIPLLLFCVLARRMLRFSALMRNPEKLAGMLSGDLKRKLEDAGVDLSNSRVVVQHSGTRSGATFENPAAAKLVRSVLLSVLSDVTAGRSIETGQHEDQESRLGRFEDSGREAAASLALDAQRSLETSPALPAPIDSGTSGLGRTIAFVVVAALLGLSLSLLL